jgi:[acyl-carrier-protein] S-malonyltransferase
MPLLSNKDGAVVTSGTDWLDRIVTQVAAPVRWDACMATMVSLGVTAIIELPPAGTLTGLAKRALRTVNQRSTTNGVTLLALNTPDQLDDARQLTALDEDSSDHLPEWRLIIAPTAGTFRSGSGADAAATSAGATVGTTTELGLVEARADRRTLLSPWPGVIIEWLVEDGDPVSQGQPLVRLEPKASGAEGANGKQGS